MMFFRATFVCFATLQYAVQKIDCQCYKGNCSDIGGQTVCYDATCTTVGGIGCNAGGTGQNCRFCGFGDFPTCLEEEPGTTLQPGTLQPGTGQTSAPAGQCNNVGPDVTVYDKCCSYGQTPAGCAAGGQQQNCRFCGTDPFLPCDQVSGEGATTPMQSTPSPAQTCVSTEEENCVQVFNNCSQTVWVGLLGSEGQTNPLGGGFQLDPQSYQNVYLQPDWNGRFWGRTGCFQCGICATGDCGGQVQCNNNGGATPATLAEITFRGYGNLDYYDISLVDGINLPMRISPIAGTFSMTASGYTCTEANCLNPDIMANCPDDFKKLDVNGNVVACQSACDHYDTDQYCCRGAYNSSTSCLAASYANSVKALCPLAYSYAYDDGQSTFTCTGSSAPSAAYKVQFC